MIRLFVAVELPEQVRDRLARISYNLAGARWLDGDAVHLTLRFIGEVDHDVAADIDDALLRVAAPAFQLCLAGVGHFGSRGRAAVLWIGVGASSALAQLQAKIESALVRTGLAPEGRKFHPHVTLARLRATPADRLAPILADLGALRLGPFTVEHFTLFSSMLGKDGAVYTPEARYPLAVGPAVTAAAD